jgi:hypothetical protein
MVDKILLSEICIIANNNIEDEDEDYKFDVKGNGSSSWGKHFATLFLMNIARTLNVAPTQEIYLDCLVSLQQRYYVEMSNNLVVLKKRDQEAQKLMVDLDQDTEHAPLKNQNIANFRDATPTP